MEEIATVKKFALQIIQSRKELKNSLSGADDLISRFIAADTEGDEEFLKDIVISFILAGRDTTSSALTWFFWLLSSRPEIEQRIFAEISMIRGRRATSDSQVAFEFEELWLYPPVPSNLTACMADDALPDGTKVRKGWFMLYSSYAMGRMERVWGADYREYRPERWLDASGGFTPESPFKYPVFHSGLMMCLGKEMAYIELKSIAACVLERFVVDVMDKDCPKQMVPLTLRTSGLPVQVRERRTTAMAGLEVAGAECSIATSYFFMICTEVLNMFV